ncbi:hypothetical protein [Kribbella shirazensis]|uniref:Uncharacterized protein n=1 Tax=Kribbella shirazensis TaxID=1105143 RepID=A0A7X6A264_9ACTN|nr:hypothetical protein [Kribbella shirazensis]NIK57904.1 hypothetical protein [Kribbella shirazensis]
MRLKDHLAAGHSEPPMKVIHAAASALGQRTITHAVATYEVTTQPKEDNSPEETLAQWDCMMLTEDALVIVTASRPGSEWYLGSEWDEIREDGASITAELIPLREVVGCSVIGVRSFGPTNWLARWDVRLRDGRKPPVPWPTRHRQETQRRHEELATALADRLLSHA